MEGYSICFNGWALDKSIKTELGLLLIISSFCANKGYTYASNEWFAQRFDVDEVTISRRLKKLENKGYITMKYDREGAKIVKRYIYVPRLTKVLTGDLQKCQGTVNKNVKENSTSINNTSINKEPDYPEFEEYAIEKAKELSYNLDKQKLKTKFMAWKEGGWKNGHGKAIKNWKTTLINTLEYLQSEKQVEDRYKPNRLY